MPGSTSIYGLPYLEPNDAPDIPGVTEALAGATEVAIAGQVPLWAYKTADESVVNNTTLQDDDHLFAMVAAGSVYDLRLRAYVNANVTPDFKFGWSVPAGATGWWSVVDVQAGTNAGRRAWSDVEAVVTTGASQLLLVEGTLIVGGTSGALRFRWAQNGANAAASIVQAGSTLRLDRVA